MIFIGCSESINSMIVRDEYKNKLINFIQWKYTMSVFNNSIPKIIYRFPFAVMWNLVIRGFFGSKLNVPNLRNRQKCMKLWTEINTFCVAVESLSFVLVAQEVTIILLPQTYTRTHYITCCISISPEGKSNFLPSLYLFCAVFCAIFSPPAFIILLTSI